MKGSMGVSMRLAVFFTMVPAITLATAQGPLLGGLVQITRVLPDGPARVLHSLPFEPNTTLVLLGTSIWFVGALVLRRPYLWIGLGTAGPLAFAYFPFGQVRWEGEALRQVFGLAHAPETTDWIWAALPVVLWTLLLLIDRIVLDAETLRERGIPADKVRQASWAAATDATLRLGLATSVALVAALALLRADVGRIAEGFGRVGITMAVAAALAVLGIMIMVRGQGAPQAADDGPVVFEAEAREGDADASPPPDGG